jgi:hypothetical protein
MKKIVFFNHAHRGDVFISRAFLTHIMEEIDIEFSYAHFWGEYLLRDMNIGYIDIDKESILSDKRHVGNFVLGNVLYINTWIGNYFNHSKPRYGECNLKSTYELMYSEIFECVRDKFKIDIQLKNIIEYFPSIDYSYFKIDGINKFIEDNNNPKVLLCNGPVLSGQCEYNGDMQDIIRTLSEKYSDTTFITTHRVDCNNQNVKHTGDIIQSNESDLNEISYLSKFCNVIVGRSSGPFTFANTKYNIFDENKSFLCFGKRETDCLPYELDIECEFIFELFSNLINLENTITGLVGNEKTI